MKKKIQLNDYEFEVNDIGQGEIIVFVHGSASDQRTWDNNLPYFSEHYRVISYSRRFHLPNKKIAENEDYSMQQHMDDLRALLTHIGDQPVHFVGHSYSALMGLELAVQNPELVRSMVLSEPPAIRLYVSNIPKPGELLSLLLKRPGLALSIIKFGATGLGPAITAAKKGDMDGALRLFGQAVLGKETFAGLSEERKKQALENFSAAELTGSGFLPLSAEKLKQLKIPVLFLTGEYSPSMFKNLTDRLLELLPNSSHREIGNASHIIHEDQPEEFNKTVMTFLNN